VEEEQNRVSKKKGRLKEGERKDSPWMIYLLIKYVSLSDLVMFSLLWANDSLIFQQLCLSIFYSG
jgi:hypothetical protein